jgi:hypothetical protein
MSILKKITIHHILFLGLFFLISIEFTAQSVKSTEKTKEKEKKEFPKPNVKNMLFYVQRTFNINTLIYALNTNEKDELDEKNPIKIYWINYTKDGSTESLNFIQRKYAYGIEIKMVDSLKKAYAFNFVSYKKKQIFLIKSAADNKYEAFMYLGTRLILLQRIFIQIEGGSFWTPKVRYLEVTGKDPIKGEEVIERIIP